MTFDDSQYDGDFDGFDDWPEEPDDEATETITCRQCGADIYEDAVQCPECGWYVTGDTSAWSDRPTWWIVLGLLGALAFALAMLGWLP
jgi:hypothetical protein